MFEKALGLPLHVLMVHAVVVFVPLLVLLALAYIVLPRFRPRLDWAVAALAVVAPITAWVATESGEALQARQIARGFSGEVLDKIEEHGAYGEVLFLLTLGLALAVILLLVATSGSSRVPRLPGWVPPVLSVVVVGLGVAALVYVWFTGHSGAEMVWGNTFE
jgi:glucan phosphoethanolaminetransferase (alkaline phosphatase superfamily)